MNISTQVLTAMKIWSVNDKNLGLKPQRSGVRSGLAKAGHSTKADLETSVRDGSSELGLSYDLVGLS